jgi:Rv0078B-related antitoxin
MIPERLQQVASWLRPRHAETPVMKRMREISDLHEFIVAAYRQRMRREHPGARKREIEAMVRAWKLAPPSGGHFGQPPREPDNDDS